MPQLTRRLLHTARIGLTLVGFGFALTGCGASTPTQQTSPQREAVAVSNLAWAEQYIAAVSAQPNVTAISDKLAYQELKSGYGCKPTADSMVRVHYEAKLAQTEQVIDSSYSRGLPDNFPLDRMVKAWKQAVPMMEEGDTWQLYVHPDLAYGAKGSGPSIPPNSAFVFTIQLLKAGTCSYGFQRK